MFDLGLASFKDYTKQQQGQFNNEITLDLTSASSTKFMFLFKKLVSSKTVFVWCGEWD